MATATINTWNRLAITVRAEPGLITFDFFVSASLLPRSLASILPVHAPALFVPQSFQRTRSLFLRSARS
jgi:hypothetical protein